MSTRKSNEQNMPGYFLPEDGQLRLARLGECIRFLARLEQPRTGDDQRGRTPEVRMEELATCLELLAEQAELVLVQVSWPAYRETATRAPESAGEATLGAPDEAAEAFAFGVTLDQIDALDRLIQMISAHGDVVAAGHAAVLADHTLPLLGQAIFDGAKTVRDIFDQVEAQRLGHARGRRVGVDEERAVYGVGLARLGADSRSRLVLLPTYQSSASSGRSHRLRPHYFLTRRCEPVLGAIADYR